MKINALRKELNSLLVQDNGRRKPAVRRSLHDEWIYATDLPEIISVDHLGDACRKLQDAGCETLAEGKWLQLRKAAEAPPAGWLDWPAGPEAECCRSLLRRHPDRQPENDQRIEYRLIKAGEEGPKAYETACRRLHCDWAERLRKKQKLPNVNPKFFEGGK